MTTKEAIQAMLNGEKVVPIYNNVADFKYCYCDGIGFINNREEYFDFNYWMRNYNDWQIYEEPKPKQTVMIEKWLCQHDAVYIIVSSSDIKKYVPKYWKPIKLLDTYEEEL